MEELLEQLDRDIEISLDNSELYLKRAEYYFDRDEYERTIEDCEAAIKMNDSFADAYALMGYAYYRLDSTKQAQENCEKAIVLDEQCYRAYVVRGNLFSDDNEYDKALIYYNKAIKINENYAVAYYSRGNAYYELKIYEEALADYTKAIQLNPEYAKAYYNRGNAFCEFKIYEEALADYTKAIELKPDYAKAYNNRGNVYCELKIYEEALAEYAKAIELEPDDAHAYFNRALLYKNTPQKNYDKALIDLKTANKLYTEQKNNTDIGITERLIEEITGLLNKAPERNSRIQNLMTKIEEACIEETNQKAEESFKAFIEERKETPSNIMPEFVILRRWNSYTPIIADDFHTSRGGGYFFHAKNCGIVIDPGFNFIDNFKAAGYRFADIDHILITHAHNDHTADVESILTLLYKYNDEILGSFDNMKDGTFMKEANIELNAKEEDRKRVEELAKDRFSKSARRKRLRFYMTASTYKKYCNLLDLCRKSDYDIEIIKAGDTISLKIPNEAQKIEDYAEDVKITAMAAKHNDLLSDKDSVGFVFEYNNTVLIYTGDTGYNEAIGNQYARLKKRCKGKKIILLAHLGGFKDYEKRYNVNKDGDFDGGKAFYKNHLGRLGLARLVEIVKPYLCIISEFGEEFRDTRYKLTQIYQEVYPNTIFFPADIGFRINNKGEIKAVTQVDYHTKQTKEEYIDPKEIGVREYRLGASLCYHKKGIDTHELIEVLSKQ